MKQHLKGLTPQQKQGLIKACEKFSESRAKIEEAIKLVEEAEKLSKCVSFGEIHEMFEEDYLGAYLIATLENVMSHVHFSLEKMTSWKGNTYWQLSALIPQLLNDESDLVLLSEEQWEGLERVAEYYEKVFHLVDVAFDLTKEAEDKLFRIVDDYDLDKNKSTKRIVSILSSIHDYVNDYAGGFENDGCDIRLVRKMLREERLKKV